MTDEARYVPDPRRKYKCPYCNELARLADADVVVDSYQNVCHLACFDKLPSAESNSITVSNQTGKGAGSQRARNPQSTLQVPAPKMTNSEAREEKEPIMQVCECGTPPEKHHPSLHYAEKRNELMGLMHAFMASVYPEDIFGSHFTRRQVELIAACFILDRKYPHD